MADQHDDERRVTRFDDYLEALLGDDRPSPQSIADAGEAEMARLAAEMAGALPADPAAHDPHAAFVEQLRLRMRAADEGIVAVQEPPPVRPETTASGIQRWRLSRRQVLQAGIGAAAGLAAGVIGAAIGQRDDEPSTGGWQGDLVAGEGFWADVAGVDEVPPGTAVRFSTTAFDGFVVNDAGEIRALSSVCTHMACSLAYRPDWHDLRCPCHGASFNLRGELANSRVAWRLAPYPGDAEAYPIDLPPLARPRVKVEDERIWIWTAQA
jgi:nitrite reductase/ring-hydroxylating ferredoxin subunit